MSQCSKLEVKWLSLAAFPLRFLKLLADVRTQVMTAACNLVSAPGEVLLTRLNQRLRPGELGRLQGSGCEVGSSPASGKVRHGSKRRLLLLYRQGLGGRGGQRGSRGDNVRSMKRRTGKKQ